MGLDAWRHEQPSQTRDWTYVPALAGGFSTTGQPGKSKEDVFLADEQCCDHLGGQQRDSAMYNV